MGGFGRPSLLFSQRPPGMKNLAKRQELRVQLLPFCQFLCAASEIDANCSLTHHFAQNSQSKASFWVSELTFSFFTPDRDTKVFANFAARQIWRMTSSSYSGISELRARHSFLWPNCSAFFVRLIPVRAICAYRSKRTLAFSSAHRGLQPETRNGPHAP